jgi:hypothetical protein
LRPMRRLATAITSATAATASTNLAALAWSLGSDLTGAVYADRPIPIRGVSSSPDIRGR